MDRGSIVGEQFLDTPLIVLYGPQKVENRITQVLLEIFVLLESIVNHLKLIVWGFCVVMLFQVEVETMHLVVTKFLQIIHHILDRVASFEQIRVNQISEVLIIHPNFAKP